MKKFNAEREKFAKLESLYEQVLREEDLEETVQQKERQNREQQQLRLQRQSKSKDKEGEQPASCEAMLRIAALEAELLKAEAVRREMFNQIQGAEGTSACFVEFVHRHRVKLRRILHPFALKLYLMQLLFIYD